MKQSYSFQSKNGGYQLERKGELVFCTFSGIISLGVARRYLADLTKIAQSMTAPWAYVANTIDSIAATPEAEPLLEQAYIVCLKNRCVGDAYYQTTAMCLAQLEKLRKRCQIPYPIEERSFADLDQAVDFVKSRIEEHLLANAG